MAIFAEMSPKHELQDIISGNGTVRHGATIQAITAFLGREKTASSEVAESKLLEIAENEALTRYVSSIGFWYPELDESKFISQGAEQRVYEDSDPNFVVKVNSRIFYAKWEDYLNNLLVHNYFFPHLAYELLGFIRVANGLAAVVKQPFIQVTETTDLLHVGEFLAENGFIRKRQNDYFNPQLGIILEDLHDENVLTSQGVLQFIDTVFFLTEDFFSPIVD